MRKQTKKRPSVFARLALGMLLAGGCLQIVFLFLEMVILSGGRTITGWRKAPSPVAGQESLPQLWTAEVPGVREGEWYFRQLFVDGERRQRVRAPNAGFYRPAGQFLPGNPSRFKFHSGDTHAAWAERGDVEVVGLEKWAAFCLPLVAVDVATNTATLAAARQEFGDDKDARYWVENAAEHELLEVGSIRSYC